MNTILDPAQQAQLDKFRAYAERALAPVAEQLVNHTSCLKQFLQESGKNGYLGLNVPKEYGGAGGGLLDVVFLVEALAEIEPGLGVTIGNHVAVIEVLKRFGTEQQKSKYLPLLARGEQFATLAFAEENAGTDYEALQGTASGASELRLAADKRHVVSGDFAGLFLVLAKKDDGGLVALLADRPASGDSFALIREHKLMGLRSAYINDIKFSDLVVPAQNVLSEPGSAVALYAMAAARVVVAASGVGLLTGASNLALGHARARQQFGVNIGQFQGVQWKLADLECERNASRLLVYRAAWSNDDMPERFNEYSAMCKWYTARAARFHSGEALQIMGAAGLEVEGAPARFFNDGKTLEITGGTSEFQKMLLVKELNI